MTASLKSKRLESSLKGWDAAAEDEQDRRLDRIMVYATLESGRFNLNELLGILLQNGLKPDLKKIDDSLECLELGFALGRDDDGTYFYQTPLFSKMIMKDDPGVRLKAEIERWAG